ncbi:hypothetical protein P154DRAFT_522452 [Amniculicola lignicola CBS 123094]|uniref:COP9 signalosome complex subunit 3 n=1 Tax=Amniculicola lignicola CBS 123094 TaxID=1392246 RepID=A0A6A5WSL9_9PLEO|nr:hypothetical protein P154DRAFT_522452 [Amniculicola lignicola CBS 123094]
MSAELLNVLFAFQPDAPALKQKVQYDKAARQFVQQVSNIAPQHFSKGADTPQDVFELLDPTTNSIAYIYALLARIGTATDGFKLSKGISDQVRPGGSLWNRMVIFVDSFDPIQIRYAGNAWRRLLDEVDKIARLTGMAALAISPIRSALLRLDPASGTFTLTHLHFIRLCMETRSYVAALPILDNYIHTIPGQLPQIVLTELEYSVPGADHTNSGEYIHHKSGHSDKVNILDVQEYYLLGAMAYIGLRQFKKAKEFLEHVLISPTSNVANGYMLEAYKKWVLCSCLALGGVKSIPRTVNGPALKQMRAVSKAYDALGQAFVQLGNLPKLRAQINAGKDLWLEDGNTGLVNELRDQQYRFYVSRLSRTFSAIPVSNIASNLGGSAEELTAYLEKEIKDGHQNAVLEQTDQGVVLRFFLNPTEGPLAKSEKQQQQALFEQTQRTNTLADEVKSADYRLSLTREYMEHLRRASKKMSAAGVTEAMDTTWDDGGEAEEDIMGDMH